MSSQRWKGHTPQFEVDESLMFELEFELNQRESTGKGLWQNAAEYSTCFCARKDDRVGRT